MNNLQKAFNAGTRLASNLGNHSLLAINKLAYDTGLIDGLGWATGNQVISDVPDPRHTIKRMIILEEDIEDEIYD